jgi:hypothetical protein
MARKTGYRWHLRRLMADRGMYATTQLRPLLAKRGVALSREQVYRLVTGVPERLSQATLAALCDILGYYARELRSLSFPGKSLCCDWLCCVRGIAVLRFRCGSPLLCSHRRHIGSCLTGRARLSRSSSGVKASSRAGCR